MKLIDALPLENELKKFAIDRNWEQFHSPKNLVMALTAEVGELVEIFQWMSEIDSNNITNKPDLLKAVENEVADVLMYVIRLSSVLNLDLDRAVKSKLSINQQKYPINKSFGSSKKYDQL